MIYLSNALWNLWDQTIENKYVVRKHNHSMHWLSVTNQNSYPFYNVIGCESWNRFSRHTRFYMLHVKWKRVEMASCYVWTIRSEFCVDLYLSKGYQGHFAHVFFIVRHGLREVFLSTFSYMKHFTKCCWIKYYKLLHVYKYIYIYIYIYIYMYMYLCAYEYFLIKIKNINGERCRWKPFYKSKVSW